MAEMLKPSSLVVEKGKNTLLSLLNKLYEGAYSIEDLEVKESGFEAIVDQSEKELNFKGSILAAVVEEYVDEEVLILGVINYTEEVINGKARLRGDVVIAK